VGVLDDVPISTLLSHALVAFTIEVDNAFELRMPHRTTAGRRAGKPRAGPWLVSLAMWSNLLRYVPADGVSIVELEERALLSPVSASDTLCHPRYQPRTAPRRTSPNPRPPGARTCSAHRIVNVSAAPIAARAIRPGSPVATAAAASSPTPGAPAAKAAGEGNYVHW
jgi:hypothetical protein